MKVAIMNKKILYTLIAALFGCVACTTEVPVTGEHPLDVEVPGVADTGITKIVYCNLKDSRSTLDLEAYASYVREVDADILFMLSDPTIGSPAKKAEVWAETTLKDLYPNLRFNSISRAGTCIVVLSKEPMDTYGTVSVSQLTNHFYFTIGEFGYVFADLGKSLSPDDRVEEVRAMYSATVGVDIDKDKWIYVLGANVGSYADVLKYASSLPESIKSTLSESSSAVHTWLSKQKMVDCVGTQCSVYTPSCSDGSRREFVYVTPAVWHDMTPIIIDTTMPYGSTHYPISVTIKNEE